MNSCQITDLIVITKIDKLENTNTSVDKNRNKSKRLKYLLSVTGGLRVKDLNQVYQIQLCLPPTLYYDTAGVLSEMESLATCRHDVCETRYSALLY